MSWVSVKRRHAHHLRSRGHAVHQLHVPVSELQQDSYRFRSFSALDRTCCRCHLASFLRRNLAVFQDGLEGVAAFLCGWKPLRGSCAFCWCIHLPPLRSHRVMTILQTSKTLWKLSKILSHRASACTNLWNENESKIQTGRSEKSHTDSSHPDKLQSWSTLAHSLQLTLNKRSSNINAESDSKRGVGFRMRNKLRTSTDSLTSAECDRVKYPGFGR